jgi:hypothetical protein
LVINEIQNGAPLVLGNTIRRRLVLSPKRVESEILLEIGFRVVLAEEVDVLFGYAVAF